MISEHTQARCRSGSRARPAVCVQSQVRGYSPANRDRELVGGSVPGTQAARKTVTTAAGEPQSLIPNARQTAQAPALATIVVDSYSSQKCTVRK